MGSVWRARDLTLNAEVAVKLIEEEFVRSKEAVDRFRREAQAAAAIRSTYVVQILDHGVDGGTPFIAMELLKGESLAERLERVGRLSPEATGHLLGQVARALALAHDSGIVHRDMKPDNIFLVREDEEDVGKVLDFGIARQTGGLGETGGLRTETGAVLGTPYYMSPEQAIGQPVDHLTDIWSFGVIACECLTGRRAFDGNSVGALFHAVCMAPLPLPSELGPVPEGFDAWFARAAARDKALRYPTIRQAADELRAICSQGSGRSSSMSYAGRSSDTVECPAVPAASANLQGTAAPLSHSVPGLPRRRGRFALVALAAPLVLGGGVYLGWRWVAGGTASRVEASTTAGPESAATPPSRPPAAPARVSPALPEQADAGTPEEKPAERPVPSVRTPLPTPAPETRRRPASDAIRDDNAAGI
jgi:serine/threonine-protein kinase